MKQEQEAYSSTHERLVAERYSPEQQLMSRKKVSTSEKGKRYTLITSGGEESVIYVVDGYIVKEGPRCDKLVLVRLTDSKGRLSNGEKFLSS